MQDLWNNLFFILERFTWSSLLDILLVTIVFGLFLYLLRDTEAQTLLRGVFLVVILITLLTSLVNLPAFSWLVKTITPALILAVPVIFTPEIRRGLERMGSFGKLRFWFSGRNSRSNQEMEELLNSVSQAAAQLSERRHGALIVIRRLEFLDKYYKNGVMLNAEVTPQLLLQIFYPNTPMHDGAVIISENRVKAAGCVMPLSSSGILNSSIAHTMGLRHRAALGISEVSDALAVVVSEETGTISIAHRGKLIRSLDGERLLNSMRAIMITDLTFKTSKLASIFRKKADNDGEEIAEE